MTNNVKQISKLPVISVITVVYNRVSTLRTAIESVINHPYPNLEYIVIDGGSTDGSKELIEEYKEQIDYFISEPDEGMYFALNKGMKMATGELIGLAHSDDYIVLNNTLELIGRAYIENAADVYYCNAFFVKEFETHCSYSERKAQHKNIVDSHVDIIHPAVVVSKKAIEKSGGYDTSFNQASDYELLLRLKLEGYQFFHIDALFCAICTKTEGRVSNSCNGHLELMTIHKKHKTGNHNKYRLSYVECRARKSYRAIFPHKPEVI